MRPAARFSLTRAERRQLRAWTSPAATRRLALRAEIVLAAARGHSDRTIARRLRVHGETVARWRARFALGRLDGLRREAPRAGAPVRVPGATVRRILRATLTRLGPNGERWTTRSLARRLRINHMLVHRVWTAHGLGNSRRANPAPGRRRIDLAGAYITDRARAVVFRVQTRLETSRPSDRLPELVPNPTSLDEFSGPSSASGDLLQVIRGLPLRARHPKPEPESDSALLVFLRELEDGSPRGARLEAVFDGPAGRLGRRVTRWLEAHPRYRLFTTRRDQSWAESVAAWLRRWEGTGLDRESLAGAASLLEAVQGHALPGSRPGPRFAWVPGRSTGDLASAPAPPLWKVPSSLSPGVGRAALGSSKPTAG